MSALAKELLARTDPPGGSPKIHDTTVCTCIEASPSAISIQSSTLMPHQRTALLGRFGLTHHPLPLSSIAPQSIGPISHDGSRITLLPLHNRAALTALDVCTHRSLLSSDCDQTRSHRGQSATLFARQTPRWTDRAGRTEPDLTALDQCQGGRLPPRP